MSTVTHIPERLTKTQAEKQIRDWKRRIEALFRQVEQWSVQEWGAGCVSRGAREQTDEYLMKGAGVRPRKLPTLEVRAAGRHITLTSSCVWIIGANGRIDMSVDDTYYMLYDMGGENGKPSDWQITNPDPRIVLEPLTREVLLRIAKARPKRRP